MSLQRREKPFLAEGTAWKCEEVSVAGVEGKEWGMR